MPTRSAQLQQEVAELLAVLAVAAQAGAAELPDALSVPVELKRPRFEHASLRY